MKKSLRSISAFALAICVALSFSSCSLFATMRDYAQKATEKIILPSPEDKDAYAEFNKALDKSVESAIKMNSSVGYDVKEIAIKNGEDKAGLLDKAADSVSKLIMANNPGKSGEEISPADINGTLLADFDNTSSLSFKLERNTVREAVTDEKGENVTDEAGEVVKTEVINDNVAKLAFLFYNDVVTEEAHTDEDGNDVAEVTERSFADEAVIEKAFGTPADKETVLTQFDCIKNYFTVNDYEITYGDCKVTSELDLDTGLLSGVNFEKTMLVTANVTGVGAFAEYGDVTVSFKLIKTDGYSFTYAEVEE